MAKVASNFFRVSETDSLRFGSTFSLRVLVGRRIWEDMSLKVRPHGIPTFAPIEFVPMRLSRGWPPGSRMRFAKLDRLLCRGAVSGSHASTQLRLPRFVDLLLT